MLTLLLVAGGGYFGGSNGAVLMFGIAAVMNFGSYWFSDRVVLRMYRARVLEPQTEAIVGAVLAHLQRVDDAAPIGPSYCCDVRLA